MMINWHNAPEYSHKGYIYKPEIEHEDEEGIRKATHRFVNRVNPLDVMQCGEHTPYRWMTHEQAKKFINKMIRMRS
jgi:hypothetical protein